MDTKQGTGAGGKMYELLQRVDTKQGVVTLYYGGGVIVNRFKLHGLAESLEQTEKLIKSTLTLIVLGQTVNKYPYSSNLPTILKSSNPKAILINSFVEISLSGLVEDALTEILNKNAEIIKKFDLRKFLGK